MEAFGSQGVPTQYVKILRALYENFTTKISLFYSDSNIDVRRGVWQGNTISPKLFTVTIQNLMPISECNDMGMVIDDRHLHHLRFADDMVLITSNISHAERMPTGFDRACGKISLRRNLKKTMFMKNGLVLFAHSRSTERISPNAPVMSI
uniref:Reverse transcriptase domain-containing protein n=1 Tax=Angiostrongylus cantonensis TaxID=6313 RepID=A0A0K0CYS8_ANGCA